MKALDLFCGAGGITRGFLKAGFDVKGVDISDPVETTFTENNHATFEKKDLLRELIQHECEVITGGPPCKPWSSVNVNTRKRSFNHRDYNLVARFFAHVVNNKPQIFLFENVPPLKSDNILSLYMKKMEKLGYSVKSCIVRYCDYGASTARRRLIVFGTKVGKSETFFKLLEDRKTRPRTVKHAIWDLRNKDRDEVHDHIWPILKTIDKYKKYYNTNKYGWYVLEWNKPAPSFGNVMKTYILHPYGFRGPDTRVVSVREVMSIMGFERNFKFPDNIGMGQKYQMAVDSVSPVFSNVSAQVIRDIINGKTA